MRKLIYYVAVSLDGFIARPDGSFDAFLHDDALVEDFFATLKRDFSAVVMGRATYEVGLAAGVTNPYPWLDTYVISRSLKEAPDEGITLLRDVADVAGLKGGEGLSIWLCGGGALAASLHEAGLIDELHLKRNPVLLGEGIPLFRSRGAPSSCTLMGPPKVYESGIVTSQLTL